MELASIASRFIFDYGGTASFTVDDKTIYGKIKLTEDNKYEFIKPANVSELAWVNDLAAIQSSGT